MQKFKCVLLVLLMCLIPTQSSAMLFSDLDHHWAEEYVYWATFDVPVFSGYPDGSYRPSQPITRAEFMTMIKKLVDAAGQNVTTNQETSIPFTDITESHWAYDNIQFLTHYLNEAKQADLNLDDIFSGVRLNPNLPITRYEVALLTHSISTPPVKTNDNGGNFSDVSPFDQHYDRINELVNNGMISGYEDGTFRPSNQLTRAEAAVMAQKIHVDLQYLSPERLHIAFPQQQDRYQYPIFDMPERRQDYSAMDRRMDNVIATLEYRSIVGFIPRDEQDLYDSTPIDTLWALKNDDYPSVIANNYYLISHDRQLVQERKDELATEALLAYLDLNNPQIPGFLTLVQKIDSYAPPELLENALKVYLTTDISIMQQVEASIRLSTVLIRQNKYQEALLLFQPLINSMTDYDMKLLLIRNEAVIRYQLHGADNAIDRLYMHWEAIENEPRYWFYEDEIINEFTALIKQLKTHL